MAAQSETSKTQVDIPKPIPMPAPIRTASDQDFAYASRPSTQMLLAISDTGKHLYQGTVDRVTVAKRRAKNKAARRARRNNR